MGVLDYESTNSSDRRVFSRDFRNYRHYVKSPSVFNVPEFWIILTTLPTKKVGKSDWYSWDKRKKRITQDDYSKMLENPFRYWFRQYSNRFNKLREEHERCPLYVVNVTSTELKLHLPNDEDFSIELD